MEEHEKIELRSEDVQEILGTPPSWLVRWGTLVIFLAIGAMIAAAWFIDYPDVIEGKAIVSTLSPPVEVVSRAEGPIYELLVKEKEQVAAGQTLAVIQSTADYKTVIALEEQVAAWQLLPIDSLSLIEPTRGLSLGEIQNDYSLFVQQLEDYKFLTSDKQEGSSNQVARLQNQISNLNERKDLNAKIISHAFIKLETAEADLAIAKKMYEEKLISLKQFKAENSKLQAAKREIEQLKSKDIETDMEITNVRKMIGEISVDNRQGTSTSTVRLRESLNNLRNTLVAWKQKYLLRAPIAGMATLNAAVFSEQQYVRQGQTVLTIAPPEGEELLARVDISVAGSGKVKKGQKVLLQLQSYPFEEFGSVEGLVTSKSLVPNGETYPVTVSLPKGLETSRGEVLEFEQQLQGTALIITENRRFVERFFDKIFTQSEKM